MASLKALSLLLLFSPCSIAFGVGNSIMPKNDHAEGLSVKVDTIVGVPRVSQSDSGNAGGGKSEHRQAVANPNKPTDKEEPRDANSISPWTSIIVFILLLSQLVFVGFGYYFGWKFMQESRHHRLVMSESIQQLRVSNFEAFSRAINDLGELRAMTRTLLEDVSRLAKDLPDATAMKFMDSLKKQEQEKYDSAVRQKKEEIGLFLSPRLAEIKSLVPVQISQIIWRLTSRHLIPEETAKDYAEAGRQLELVDLDYSALVNNRQPTANELNEQYWSEKVDAVARRVKRLPAELSQDVLISVVDKIWKDPNLEDERNRLFSALNLKLVIPSVKQYLDKPELEYMKVVGSKGAGKRMYVKEVIAPGIQRIGTVNWIQNPKVIVENE